MSNAPFKILRTNLDYGFTKKQLYRGKTKDGEEDYLTYPELTGQLILIAFTSNHQQMDADEARFYRMLRLVFGDEVDHIPDEIQLSRTDFDRIYDEMHKCSKWPAFQAFAVPVLLDELSVVKNRTQAEDEAKLEEFNRGKSTQSNS